MIRFVKFQILFDKMDIMIRRRIFVPVEDPVIPNGKMLADTSPFLKYFQKAFIRVSFNRLIIISHGIAKPDHDIVRRNDSSLGRMCCKSVGKCADHDFRMVFAYIFSDLVDESQEQSALTVFTGKLFAVFTETEIIVAVILADIINKRFRLIVFFCRIPVHFYEFTQFFFYSPGCFRIA